jgi:hypothetical protein
VKYSLYIFQRCLGLMSVGARTWDQGLDLAFHPASTPKRVPWASVHQHSPWLHQEHTHNYEAPCGIPGNESDVADSRRPKGTLDTNRPESSRSEDMKETTERPAICRHYIVLRPFARVPTLTEQRPMPHTPVLDPIIPTGSISP